MSIVFHFFIKYTVSVQMMVDAIMDLLMAKK